ncbi:MAG: DUF2892 domain-containing protein [Cyclobacteriaceae bacterium]|nr:DUF2892 domain-containing protein [Cyclobacteriaceae bacterium]
MNKNMVSADRIIRLIVSAIFVILYFNDIVTGTVGLVLVIVAGIFTLTSLMGFCPIYGLFGINKKK